MEPVPANPSMLNLADSSVMQSKKCYKSREGIVMKDFKIKETNRIEYKQELNGKLEREVVSFLNYPEGGTIYIGIDDQGNIVGVANTDEIQLKIKDRIK